MNAKTLLLLCSLSSAAVAFVVASIVAPLGTGLFGPRIIRADMLVIDGASSPGKIVIADMSAGPSFSMLDANEKVRVDISVTPIGVPVATFSYPDGTAAIRMWVANPPDGPELTVRPQGSPAAWGVKIKADGTVERIGAPGP